MTGCDGGVRRERRMRPNNRKRKGDQSLTSLVTLLSLGEAEVTPWNRKELGDVLAHQLRAPLCLPLFKESDVATQALQTQREGTVSPPAATFESVLFANASPMVSLRAIKDFAKAHLHAATSARLPREVAAVLYFSSVIAAFKQHRVRISQLDDASLRQGIAWVLKRPWVDNRLKGWLREGLDALPQG